MITLLWSNKGATLLKNKYIEALIAELKGAKDDSHAAAIRADLKAHGHDGPESQDPAAKGKTASTEASA